MVMSVRRRKYSLCIVSLCSVLVCLVACAPPEVSLSLPATESPQESPALLPRDLPAVTTEDVAVGDATLWETDFATAEAAYQRALQSTADFGAVYGRLSFLYALQPERWLEATATGQKAVDLARDDAEAWAYLSLAHALNGHSAQALEAAGQALDLNRDLPLAHVALAQTYLLRNEVDLSLQHAALALASDPHAVWAWLIQAQAQIRVQSYDAALTSAEQALREAPDFVPAHLILAQAHRAAWEQPEAQAALEEALRRAPQCLSARLYQIQAAIAAGQLDAATLMMARLERDWPNIPAVLNAAGQLALQRQDYATASSKFQQLLGLDADSAPGYLGLAQAQYGQKNCWASQVTLSQALALLPDSGAGYLALAQNQECLGDAAAARENYARSITFPGDTPAILQTVATYTAQRGDRAGALALRRTLLIYQPDAPQLYVALGYSYLDGEGDLEAAAGNFRQALLLDSGNVAALIGVGRIYNAYAMPQQAVEIFQHALTLDPHSHEARVGIGIAYALLGRPDEAITYLEPVLQTPPADSSAYLYLARAYRTLDQYPQAGAALEQFLARQPASPVAAILATTAQSHISRRYWIQQENVTETLQEILGAVNADSPFSLTLTSLEVVKQGRQRTLNVVMTLTADPADNEALHQAIALAAFCSSAVTPRMLPAITGGVNLTLRDRNDAAVFAVWLPAPVAQDIGDGLIRDYAAFINRVSSYNSHLAYTTFAAQTSPVAGSVPATQFPLAGDSIPTELRVLLDGDALLQYSLALTPTGGPYNDFWDYVIPTQPGQEPLSWSRLEGRWHRIRSAGMGIDATQTYLSRRISPDLADRVALGLQNGVYGFFQHRADRRGLLIWQTRWDSSESARKFVMAQRLIYATQPVYREIGRDLHGGQRSLRWAGGTRVVQLHQQGQIVWLVFATCEEDLDAAIAFFSTN